MNTKMSTEMHTGKLDVQQALQDIALIRHVLNQSDQPSSDARLAGITLDANLLLQTTAMIAALVLLLVEVFSGNSMTNTLLYGGHSLDMVHTGVGLMGLIVGGLLVALYFILWRAAKHSGEATGIYIRRNFRYMQNLSLISDLLIKFATLSLFMLAGKPQWIAPALMAFTGDYLLQSRFFTLPGKLSAVLGSLCIAAAVTQFLNQSTLLVLPLLAFTLSAAISVGRLGWRLRQQSQASM